MAPKAKRKSKAPKPKVYSCPHKRDLIHHNSSGCSFTGSLEELHAHIGLCPFEADEIARLAASFAEYCDKYPDRAVEALTMSCEAVQRLMADDLDEVEIEYRDKKPVSARVRGLCTQPMLERLAGEALSTFDETERFKTWKEFEMFCLPSFGNIRIHKKRVKGAHFVDNVITSDFRGDLEPAEVKDRQYWGEVWSYSRRVWMRALATVEQMRKTPLDGPAVLARAVSAVDGEFSFLPAVLRAFRLMDEDGSGTISQDELATAFQKLDSSLSRADIDAMFVAADANLDGCIDYVEFIAWVWKVKS